MDGFQLNGLGCGSDFGSAGQTVYNAQHVTSLPNATQTPTTASIPIPIPFSIPIQVCCPIVYSSQPTANTTIRTRFCTLPPRISLSSRLYPSYKISSLVSHPFFDLKSAMSQANRRIPKVPSTTVLT